MKLNRRTNMSDVITRCCFFNKTCVKRQLIDWFFLNRKLNWFTFVLSTSRDNSKQ